MVPLAVYAAKFAILFKQDEGMGCLFNRISDSIFIILGARPAFLEK